MASNGNLSTKQNKAIAALLSSPTVEQAAIVAGVGERTLHRWLAEDTAFQVALQAAEGQAIDIATRRLVQLQDSAIDVLDNTMTDAGITPGVRLRAATSVIDSMLRLRELRNIEARLSALEMRLDNETS